jgi:hypothetical protein
MSKFYGALLPLLVVFHSGLALAEDAEVPMETSTIGVVLFIIASLVCIGLFGWYMWKNEKKSDAEKLGDKF